MVNTLYSVGAVFSDSRCLADEDGVLVLSAKQKQQARDFHLKEEAKQIFRALNLPALQIPSNQDQLDEDDVLSDISNGSIENNEAEFIDEDINEFLQCRNPNNEAEFVADDINELLQSRNPSAANNIEKKTHLIIDLRYLALSMINNGEVKIFEEHKLAMTSASEELGLNYCCIGCNVGDAMQKGAKQGVNDDQISKILEFINMIAFSVESALFASLNKTLNRLLANNAKALTKKHNVAQFLACLMLLQKFAPSLTIIQGDKSANDRTTAVTLAAHIMNELITSRLRPWLDMDTILDGNWLGHYALLDENGYLNPYGLSFEEQDLITRILNQQLAFLWSVNQHYLGMATNINYQVLASLFNRCNFIPKTYWENIHLGKVGD